MSRGLDIDFAAPAAVGGGVVAWDPQVDLNPRHYWRASNVNATSNLIDQINDIGRVGGKPFTASGSNRATLGTDTPSGQAAIFPDGVDDHYVAGAAADWKFLSDGSPWTAAACYYMPSAFTAFMYLLSTTTGGGAVTGTWIAFAYNSATQQGPWSLINSGTGGNVIAVEDRRTPVLSANVYTTVHVGATNPSNTFLKPTNSEMMLRHLGQQTSAFLMKQGDSRLAYNTGNPGGALTLFASTNFNAHFGNALSPSARLFELWIDDKAVSQRHLLEYEKWCNSRYKAAV